MAETFNVIHKITQSYNRYSLADREKYKTFDKLDMEVPLIIRLTYLFEREAQPALDVVFVIDRSGSMDMPAGDGWGVAAGKPLTRMAAVSETLQVLTGQLRPTDRAAVIAFDYEAVTVCPLSAAADFQAAVKAMPAPRGSTDIGLALTAATDLMRARAESRPGVVVLLTDGFAEKAPPGDPQKMTPDQRAQWDRDLAGIRKAYRETALAAATGLADAGLDLITLGFGDKYDEDLLVELNARAGRHEAWYIDTREKAQGALADALTEQQNTVLENAKFEAVLNTEHFMWEGVWQLLPKASLKAPVRLGKEKPLAAPAGSRAPVVPERAAEWRFPLGNVTLDRYTVLLTATPRTNLPVGTVPVGQFWLTWKGQEATAPKTLALDVQQDRITSASASLPNNPDRESLRNWFIARTTDFRAERDRHAAFSLHTEALASAQKVIEYHEKAKNQGPEKLEDEEWLVKYRADKNLPPNEKKKAAERLSQSGTAHSESSFDSVIKDADVTPVSTAGGAAAPPQRMTKHLFDDVSVKLKKDKNAVHRASRRRP